MTGQISEWSFASPLLSFIIFLTYSLLRCCDPHSWYKMYDDTNFIISTPGEYLIQNKGVTVLKQHCPTDAAGNVCSKNGACQTNGVCKCNAGYYGTACGGQCPSTTAGICGGHGTCSDGATGTGKCTCSAGYGTCDSGACSTDLVHDNLNCGTCNNR